MKLIFNWLKNVCILIAMGIALIFLAGFIAAYGTFEIIIKPHRKW